MTKEQLIELVKFTAGEIIAPNELSTEDAESIVDDFVDVEQLTIPVVMPRFLKTKYSLERLDEHIHELSCRTEHWIHRGKLEDVEKLIRWRRRYDALNGA